MPSELAQAQRFYEGYHSEFVVIDDAPQVLRELRNDRRAILKFGIPPGAELLDLSCGQGLFLKAASEMGVKVTGLDFSRVAVAAAKKRVPAAKVVVGNAEKLPFKDASFDWVSCWGSLEHYAHPEAALKEIRRVLKPGGQALLSLPNLFFIGHIYLVYLTGEPPHEAKQNEHEKLDTRVGWETMLRGQGFKIDAVGKDSDMYASRKVPRLVIWLYTLFIKPFVPLNLCYCFHFLISKDPAFRAGKAKKK